MFLGTTPQPIRDYLARQIAKHKPKRLWEPCAGLFAVSQIAFKAAPEIEVISGDVSKFSNAIGYGLAGRDGAVGFSEIAKARWPILGEFGDSAGVAAGAIVLTEIAQIEAKVKHRYYSTLLKDAEAKLPESLAKMRQKVAQVRSGFRRFRYEPQDCVLLPDQVEPGDWVWFDPPYFSGGYESMLGGVEPYLDCPDVPYTEMTEEIRTRTLQELAAAGTTVWHRPEHEIAVPGFSKVFSYQYTATNRYQLYVNTPQETAQGGVEVLRTRPGRYDVLFRGDRLTRKTKATIGPIDGKVANYYRLLWTKKALIRDAGDAWALSLDGKLAAVVKVMASLVHGSQFAVLVTTACRCARTTAGSGGSSSTLC